MSKSGYRKGSGSPESVAEQAMPGWKAVRLEDTRTRVGKEIAHDGTPKSGTDAVLPTLDQLRQKFLGKNRGSDPEQAILDAPNADDIQMVEMQSGEHRKTVAVKKGRVVWSQG